MTNYLFLDIDGVLNAVGALLDDNRTRQAWPDYELVNGERYGETVSPAMLRRLNAIIETHDVQVTWLTTWEQEAPAFGHKIGLRGALDWPWLDTADKDETWGKWHSIRQHQPNGSRLGNRVAWIDDDMASEHEAALWAAKKRIHAFAPHPRHGLTHAQLINLDRFFRGDHG